MCLREVLEAKHLQKGVMWMGKGMGRAHRGALKQKWAGAEHKSTQQCDPLTQSSPVLRGQLQLQAGQGGTAAVWGWHLPRCAGHT